MVPSPAPAPAPAPGTRHPRHWGLWDAVGSLLGFVAVSFVFSIGLTLLGVDTVAASVVATVLGWGSLAGWPVVATRRRGSGPRTDLRLAFRLPDLWIGIAAALVVFVAAVIFAGIYVQITGQEPTSSVGNAASSAHARWEVVALALMTLVAPFMEELHFRGLWWGALRRRGLGAWPTLIVTAVLFAATHLEPSRAAFLFAAGLAAGFVRMRTDRLGPAIVVHFGVNLVAALGLLGLLG